MCWVMISTKFAVVQCASSVGGSPSTATFSTPPFLGVCAWASSPVTATRPATNRPAAIRNDKPDRNPRLMANLPRDQAWVLDAMPEYGTAPRALPGCRPPVSPNGLEYRSGVPLLIPLVTVLSSRRSRSGGDRLSIRVCCGGAVNAQG